MYTGYFGLREYPFGLTSDLRFFYKAPLHEEAHTNIVTAIRERKGLMLLTGEPGTGKTTLLHRLAQTLGDSAHILWLPLAAPTFAEILSHLCEQCTLSHCPYDDVDVILGRLTAHLLQATTSAKTVALFIDEAQHLDPPTLRHLSQLVQLAGPHGKLLQIVLAGHPELEKNLAHPEAHILHQDLASWQRLSPFPNECIETYIRHRLNIAGCDRPELFTPEAIRTVGFYSHAIPRLINVICDNALLTAYRLDLPIIPLEVIVQVVDDLHLAIPALAVNQQPTSPFLQALRMTPHKAMCALRAPLQPLVWISIGMVIGWLTAPQQLFTLPTARLSGEITEMSDSLQDSLPTPSFRSHVHPLSQEAQSVLYAFGTPASTLLPAAAPVAAAVLDPQESPATTTLPSQPESIVSPPFTRSIQPPSFSPPSLAASAESSRPASMPPRTPVSNEVARIIAILKHPVSP